MTKESDKFSLELPPTQIYINMLLLDIKNYQERAESKDSHIDIGKSLKRLLTDMPPNGKDYMAKEIKFMFENFDHWHQKLQGDYDPDIIFDKAHRWLWDNVFEDHIHFAKAKEKRPEGKL